MGKKAKTRNYYMVKSGEGIDGENADELRGKDVYFLRTSDEIIHKYMDVFDQFTEQDGKFIIVSQDKLFVKNMLKTLSKDMLLPDDSLLVITTLDEAQKLIKEQMGQTRPLLLFIEYFLNGQSTLSFINYLKNDYKNVKVIALSKQVDQARLALFYEMGVDNFITKPPSINMIVEKTAFTLQPQREIDILIRKGRDQNGVGNYEQAVQTAQAIFGINPNSAAGHVIMGDALKGLGQREKAFEQYTQAMEVSEVYLEPVMRLAEYYEEDGDQEKVLEYQLILDQRSPLNLQRKFKIGEMQFGMGRTEEAENVFDKAINIANKEAMNTVAEMSMNIAETMLESRPELSEKYFRKSLDLMKRSGLPMSPRIYNRLGIALRKQGKWREAIDEYKQALEISPEDENIHYNLAMAFAEGKDFENALQSIKKAMQINPEFFFGNANVCYSIGIIYQKLDYKSQALQFYRHVQEIDPEFRGISQKIQAVSQ